MKRILLLKDVDTYFWIIYLDSKSFQTCTTMPLFCWPRFTRNLSIFKSKQPKKVFTAPCLKGISFKRVFNVAKCKSTVYTFLMPRLRPLSLWGIGISVQSCWHHFFITEECPVPGNGLQAASKMLHHPSQSWKLSFPVLLTYHHSWCSYLPKESESLLLHPELWQIRVHMLNKVAIAEEVKMELSFSKQL